MKQNYYLTFGQKHPLKNGYILVQATDYFKARAKVQELFAIFWANLYRAEEWKPEYFPAGQFGETIEAE